MKFNEQQLIHLSLKEGDFEGRLNYKKINILKTAPQVGYKERWFKLKANLLFYFKLNEIGHIESEPAGVFVLENTSVKHELSSGSFSFSISFRDDPEKKHMFCARSEDSVNQWVSAIEQANYGRKRSELINLQTQIKKMTGKDPLLIYPYNKGMVKDTKAFISSLGAKPSLPKGNAASEPPGNVGNLIEF